MRPDLMYLSTTDYVQHKPRPGTPDRQRVLRHDGPLCRRARRAGLRHRAHRRPRHERQAPAERRARRASTCRTLLDDWLGKGAARVILPITDPYVVHHGALGSFATVYLPDGADVDGSSAAHRARSTGIDAGARRRGGLRALRAAGRPHRRHRGGLDRATRCSAPRASRHDLSGLTEPLRSHGGLTEQAVPMIVQPHARAAPSRPPCAISTSSTSRSTTSQ